MNERIVTFGEIMGRIEPEKFLRFRQGMPGNLHISFFGAEANVAASLQMMGRKTRYVTALPENAIGDACLDSVRRFGIDTDYIIRTEHRLGLYFVETGANQRPSTVIYDRGASAVSLAGADAYPWNDIFAGASWFHISGITPALSKEAAEASMAAVKACRKQGITVSCDLNYRNKLWKWNLSLSQRELAEKTMRGILPYVDIVIGNEEDASIMLGITAGKTDVHKGQLDIERYPDVAGKIVQQFPNVKQVAITLRESISASHNNWGAMLYEAASEASFFAPQQDGIYTPYEIRNIVDRVGGGDAFAAGLVYALTDKKLSSSPGDCIAFAAAASCLAHSIQGDYNYASPAEVYSLMEGNASGRVSR